MSTDTEQTDTEQHQDQKAERVHVSRRDRRAVARRYAAHLNSKTDHLRKITMSDVFQPKPNPTRGFVAMNPGRPFNPHTGAFGRPVILGDTWNGVPLQRAACVRGSCLDKN